MGAWGCAGASRDTGQRRLSPAWLLGPKSSQRKAQIFSISLQGFRGQSHGLRRGPTGQAPLLWPPTHLFIREMLTEVLMSRTGAGHISRKQELERRFESWPSFPWGERRRRNATDRGQADAGGAGS